MWLDIRRDWPTKHALAFPHTLRPWAPIKVVWGRKLQPHLPWESGEVKLQEDSGGDEMLALRRLGDGTGVSSKQACCCPIWKSWAC